MKIPLLQVMIAFLSLAFIDVQAQDFSEGAKLETSPEEAPIKEKYNIREHLLFGGNLGARFGTVTFINVQPLVAYRINDKVTLGTRGIYQYYRNNFYGPLSSHVMGGGAFGQYFFTRNIYAQSEYQFLNGFFDGSGERVNLPFLFFGGGYFYRISDYAGFNISALYEVLRMRTTPNAFPFIQVGFVVRP